MCVEVFVKACARARASICLSQCVYFGVGVGGYLCVNGWIGG